MVELRTNSEAHKFANSVLILGSSFLILAIILRFVLGNTFWTATIAFSCAFILCLGYYVRVTLKPPQKKDEENNHRKNEVDGS